MDTAQRRKQTRTLLTHYLTLIADKAGVPLHGDCYKEIGDITDLIFDEIADHSQPEHKGRLFKCEMDDRSTGPDWDAA